VEVHGPCSHPLGFILLATRLLFDNIIQNRSCQSVLEGIVLDAGPILVEGLVGTEGVGLRNSEKESKRTYFPAIAFHNIMEIVKAVTAVVGNVNGTLKKKKKKKKKKKR
jgi:hypothetical protein